MHEYASQPLSRHRAKTSRQRPATVLAFRDNLTFGPASHLLNRIRARSVSMRRRNASGSLSGYGLGCGSSSSEQKSRIIHYLKTGYCLRTGYFLN
jgi:hypothetical protein